MKIPSGTVNMHHAKTHLSRLVNEAVEGKSFVIAKSGKPLVKVTRLDTPSAGQVRRLGFLSGEITVPRDFDHMGTEEIEERFRGR